jgi:DNA-binding winged helix-turn-helix (wHTH) protein
LEEYLSSAGGAVSPHRRLIDDRDGEEVMVLAEKSTIKRPVQQLPLRLLAHLVEQRWRRTNADKPYLHNDLLDHVWGEGLGFIDALHHAIAKLKEAFSDATQNIIETVSGRGYRFLPDVVKEEPPGQAVQPPPKPRGRPDESDRPHARGAPSPVIRLDSDEIGAQYLATQYNSPHLKRVLNTYVRLEQHQGKYRNDTVLKLSEGLAGFLDRSAEQDGRPCFFHVIGGEPEIPYLDALVVIAASGAVRADKVAFRWLHGNTPIMNFVVLEYGDNDKEVLFGWGGHTATSSEAVFQSSDPILVKQFTDLYDLFLREAVSRSIDLSELKAELARRVAAERQNAHNSGQGEARKLATRTRRPSGS